MSALDDLYAVIARLRDPKSGCAWDRERTLANILPSLKSEIEELEAALTANDGNAIHEELGDVFFNALMIARVAEETGLFSLDAMLRATAEKFVRRHPHVFGAVRADTPEAASSGMYCIIHKSFELNIYEPLSSSEIGIYTPGRCSSCR